MKISEYFEQALQDGYPWAQAALDNFKTSMTLDWEVSGLAHAITCAFTWSSAPEGYDYWNKVWENLIVHYKK